MKTFGPFRLDTANHCLWRADARMPLTPKAFDVLRYLVEHSGRLITQEEILQALWPGTYVNPENIRKYILEVRKVLGDRPSQAAFIETLPKRGYQFIAPVLDEQASLLSVAALESAGNVVGRDAALTRLNNHFQRALDGQRQVIFVTGEAGVGKTTLVDLFMQRAASHSSLRLARGQCIEGFGGKEAYYPVLEAVGSLINSAKDDSVVQTLERAPTWLAQFPSLVKPEQRGWLQREISGSTRGRMVRELCEALEAMTAAVPLIVILEDLHWVDSSTLDLISAFARRREPAKLLLICTYRPVDVVLSQSPLKALKEDLLVRQICDEVTIERLEESEVAAYLAREFPGNHLPAGLASLIHHNSGGNPLFMVAIVRDIVKRGLMIQDRGTWTLTAPLEEIYPGIPETLQQMLDGQFAQLGDQEQRILQSGSVAGERFSVWAAAVMLDMPPGSIEETCDTLARRQQFIRFVGMHESSSGAYSAHFEFRHSLYRQALYRGLSTLLRSQLHRSLAEQLVAARADRKRELASELALHFEEGRDYGQAAAFLLLSAENASRRFAHGDSIRVLQHALELIPLLDPAAQPEMESRILQRIGDAHYALGAMSESLLAYETAVARAAGAGLKREQIAALARLASPAWYLDPARGNGVCEQAIEVSRELADPLFLAQTQLAAACFRLIYDAWRTEDEQVCVSARQTIRSLNGATIPEDLLVQIIQGDYATTRELAEAGLIATGSPAAYLLAVEAKILILIGSGQFGELLRMIRAGRESAERNGEDPWLFIFREIWLRSLCFDFDGVFQLSNIIMRSDAEQHAAQPRAMAMFASAYVELFRGKYDAALQYFGTVRDLVETPKFFLHWRWRMRAQLGAVEVRLQTGDLENARLEADSFLESALSTGEPNLHAYAWEARARVAIAGQDRASALQCVENALAVLEQFDLPVAAWRVHATAWDFYRYAEEHDRAEGHRAQAEAGIIRLADSFEPDEPLRQSLLEAAPVRRILQRAALA